MALVRVNFKTIWRKFSSALYITGDKAQSNFVVLTPCVDFDELLKHKSELIKSIEARKLSIDLDKVEKRWNFYKMIDDHKTVLEMTKTEIGNMINKLKQTDAEKNKPNIDKLHLHIKLVKDDLKNVKDYSYGVEENAMLGVLGLPNFLHQKSPVTNEIVVHEFSQKPTVIDVSHIEIGESQNLIEYTDPTFYFLKSDASLFEFAITNYLQSKLLELGLVQFSNADFARSVVIEGCGTDNLHNNIFSLASSSSEINRLHIVGGGSLYSFMAYFAKYSVQSTLLPLKCFSHGRKYTPVNQGSNLFDLSQTSVGHIFVATEDDTDKMDEIFDNLTQEIVKIYEALGYHFRLVFVPANALEKGESLKLSIQMFSNYLETYIEVGNLSIYDDYLSKRLLFTYTANKDRKFVRVIAGEVLNIQKILGCVLENNFSDKKPLLTNLLQKYL